EKAKSPGAGGGGGGRGGFGGRGGGGRPGGGYGGGGGSPPGGGGGRWSFCYNGAGRAPGSVILHTESSGGFGRPEMRIIAESRWLIAHRWRVTMLGQRGSR